MSTQDTALRDPAAPESFLGICAPQHRRFILIAAILASAMGFIDSTVVTIALPSMRESLGASLVQAQWFSNAYMLFLSALILAGGALGDRLGLVRVFRVGLVIFVCASLACALVRTPEQMIVARALKGIGGALIVPGSLALIAKAYPRPEQSAAIGVWAAASALTTGLGPMLGGLILTFGGPEAWRWIFALNLPFGLVVLWLLALAITRDPKAGNVGLDGWGMMLATGCLGALSLALTMLTPGLFGLAAVLAAGFLWHEARHPHPMLPLGLFRNRMFAGANLATFLLYAALSAIMFFLPMTLINTWGVSEFEVAFAFAPLTVFIFLLSARVGKWAERVGPGRPIALGSALVALAFITLGATAPLQSFWTASFPALILFGIGMSAVVAPLSAAVMGAVNEDQSGVASGVNNAVSRVAGLLGVAAGGSLISALYTAQNGPLNFASPGMAPNHVEATTWAFTALCITAAINAIIAAFIASRLEKTQRT